jgi:hypothetical protein
MLQSTIPFYILHPRPPSTELQINNLSGLVGIFFAVQDGNCSINGEDLENEQSEVYILCRYKKKTE